MIAGLPIRTVLFTTATISSVKEHEWQVPMKCLFLENFWWKI